MEASAEMAPVETAAPMTEAPQTEAPEPEPMRFSVGVIVHDYTLEDLPQQLTEHLHASGVDAEVEAMYASNMMEVHDAALVTIASGFDALILQLSDTTDTHLVQILEQACAADIPTILVGYDPGYSAGTGPALENYPNVCYVGADPRELADSMSWMLLGCGDSPDKNNDDTIGYAFLGGTDGLWETHVIDWWLPNTMRERGYGCVQLGKYPDLTYPEEAIEHLEETLVYYYESLEAVFCTDADMVVGAVLTCEMAGVDMQNGIAIIGMGDTEEMEEYYAMGYLKGYVEYSREALVDQLTWVLLEAVRGETLEPYYPVGFEIHVAE
jgi:ABC-type sugar transport system substrate-binding protein